MSHRQRQVTLAAADRSIATKVSAASYRLSGPCVPEDSLEALSPDDKVESDAGSAPESDEEPAPVVASPERGPPPRWSGRVILTRVAS